MIAFAQYIPDEPLPSVSIIIPVYNSARWIERCLDSVVGQAYLNWEAVVVYSPGTDNTLSKLQKYLSNPNIRIIVEPKSNCATARNHGIEVSHGDYIAFLDADDWWEPGKLKRGVELLDSNPDINWCATYVIWHYPSGIIREQTHPGTVYGIGGVGTIVIRKSALDTVKKRDGYVFNPAMGRVDDADLVLRIRTMKSKMIPEYLSHYYWNEDGLSARTSRIRQSLILITICVRNGAWSYVPYHVRDLLVSIFNWAFKCDIVKIKKEIFR